MIIASVRIVMIWILPNSIKRVSARSGASAVIVVIAVQVTKRNSTTDTGDIGILLFSRLMVNAIMVTTAAISANWKL